MVVTTNHAWYLASARSASVSESGYEKFDGAGQPHQKPDRSERVISVDAYDIVPQVAPDPACSLNSDCIMRAVLSDISHKLAGVAEH